MTDILITDCETTAALECTRALAQAGFTVHGVSTLSSNPTRWSRFLSSFECVPSPWLEPHSFSEACWNLFERKKIKKILPVSEAAIVSLLKHPHNTNEDLIVANAELLKLGLSKIAVFERAIATGVRVAKGRVFSCYTDAFAYEDIGWPRFIRTDNHTNCHGQYQKGGHWKTHSLWEYRAVLNELRGSNQNFLVQEHITGHGCGVFVLLHEGQIVLWHSHLRLAEIPWTGGVSARRRFTFEHALLENCAELLKGLAVTGIAMLEFKKGFPTAHRSQEETFLVEVNARPWGSMALARHGHVPFLPTWLSLTSEGGVTSLSKKSDPSSRTTTVCQSFTSTSLWPGEIQHLGSVLRSYRRRELSPRDAFRYFCKSLFCVLNPKTKFDFFTPDDWRPAMHQTFSFVGHLITWVSSALRRISPARKPSSTQELNRLACLLNGLAGKERIAVLIICQGNRCRSPFLALLCERRLFPSRYHFFSRGLLVRERDIPNRFHSLFQDQGLNPASHSARQISEDDLNHADIIFSMDSSQNAQIAMRFGKHLKKKCFAVGVFDKGFQDVQDPFLLAPLEAAQVFDRLKQIATQLIREFHPTR